ncbi:MAG: lipid A biosynthesis acyltransferase [Granulosicoccus sp.]
MSQPKIPLSPRTWPSWLGAGALTLVWLLPARLRNGFAAALARHYSRHNTSQRRTAEINFQACFPELDDNARRAFFTRYLTAMMQSVFLTPRLWWGSALSIQKYARYHGIDYVDAARAVDQPVVLLVSHTVALDVGMIAMSPDYPLQGFYKPFDNPVVDWLVHRSRTRFGGYPVARGNGFRAMIKGLKSGAILCYLSDEDLGPKGSVFAPFFGHQKATLAMLSRIVKNTNAVVIPMASYYNAEDDRFDVHFLAPLKDYPCETDVLSATKMNEAVEATVRLNPEQYLWKLRLFRTCPDGGGSRYRRIESGEMTPADL